MIHRAARLLVCWIYLGKGRDGSLGVGQAATSLEWVTFGRLAKKVEASERRAGKPPD
jgi:hypothetical protein